MAEARRGDCSVCGREGAVTADGGLRHHFTEDPEQQAGPDSRKCRGVGLPPAGVQGGGTPGNICRVCSHPVQLTSNGRARSHLSVLDGKSCAGGSDWPLAVDTAGNRTDTAPRCGHPYLGPSTEPVLCALPPHTEGDHRDGTADADTNVSWPYSDPRDATVTRPVETVGTPPYCEACDTDTHRCPGCGTDVPHGTVACKECAAVECACNLQWASGRAMRAAGHDDMDCDGAPMVPPASQDAADADDLVFDATHRLTDSTGTEWVHPGTAPDCRLPDCCTHPGGFVYADDDNGHSGSFCRDCGVPEPEPGWHTPAHLLADMPLDVQTLAATGPECWDCGHEVAPRAHRFGPDGGVAQVAWECQEGFRSCHPDRLFEEGVCRPRRPEEARLGDLDEGDHFTRRKIPGTVYRAVSCTASAVEAVVVSAGPYKGRLGTLTNLEEEITWTDEHGTPRPRRSPELSGSALAARPETSAAPFTSSTPSRPVPMTPNAPQAGTSSPTAPESAPGSTPPTPVSAPDAGTSSTRVTASGPTGPAATSARTAGTRTALPDAFTTAKAAVSESEKYDNYGRYKLLHPDTGKKVKWTRATTFAKSVQDTYALSMWSQRMTLKGAALRADIVAAVSTLDVKADKDRVNTLVEDAKKAAGDKVAANKGTAIHAFTEDRDRALVGMPVKEREVPEEFVPTVEAYEEILRAFGLEPVPGLIEFTTAVKQYEVAGTSDRVYRVTRDITVQLNGRSVTLYAGEYVIGDVKSGADLSYGWQEIAIQLALYAQGINTSGVWNWEYGTWAKPHLPDNPDVLLKVRTDVGIIPHLPVDRTATGAPLATLYAVDLDAGWTAAVLCASVRTWRKERKIATALEIADVTGEVPQADPQRPVSRPVVASRPVTLEDRAKAVTSRAEASSVFQEAKAARVTVAELNRLTEIMQRKLESFVEQGS